MKALQYRKSIPRYLLVRLLGGRWPRIATGPLSLIGLKRIQEPPLPGPEWVRVRTRLCGICGSDLATIRAAGSSYFSPLISFPFVLGHEIVGEVVESGSLAQDLAPGERVVVEPVLSCDVRGISDPCRPCRAGNDGNCEHVTRGPLAPGIQIGFCRDTGGGMSPLLVVHRQKLHRVPPGMPDEVAVLAEPFSCALHAALASGVSDTDTVLVLGSGSVGLLTIAALRALGRKCRILATAKYAHQETFARALGADETLPPGPRIYEAIAHATGGQVFTPELGKPVMAGGVDATFDCIGSSSTLDDALRLTRARGRVVVVGMPSIHHGIDWTSIWYKELEVKGAYTYGTETIGGQRVRTFDLAMRILAERGEALRPLVSARFPLGDYRQAIAHAMHTGRSHSVKTVFEFPTGGAR